MADKLVIAPDEIVAVSGDTTYVLGQITGLSFVHEFVYYEPENGNSFKVLDIEGELIRKDLTEEDITNIKAVLADTATLEENKLPTFEVEEVPAEEEVANPVHLVDADGVYCGLGEVTEGFTEVSSEQPKANWLDEFGVVSRWNGTSWETQGGYSEKRKERYLSEVGITNQVAALMNAINALANGEAVSSEFTDLYTKISAIKSDIPKE